MPSHGQNFPSDYQSLGETESGRAFVEKYLHPPGESLPGYKGIPDRQSASASLPQFRDTYTVTSPGGGGGKSWSCLLFMVNNVLTPLFMWKWYSDSNPEQSFNAAFVSKAGGLETRGLASNMRTVARSVTAELDCTGTTDSGVVYAAQTFTSHEKALRTDGSPDIIEEIDPVTLLRTTKVGATSKLIRALNWDFKGELPSESNSGILQLSPGSYQGNARDGVFMPMKYANPTSRFGDVDAPFETPETNVKFSAYFKSGGTFNVQNKTLIENGDPIPVFALDSVITPGTTRFVNPYPQDDMSTGWILFTGLNDAASLRLKIVQAVECSVPLDSPWSPFTETPPLVDSYAVDMAYRYRAQMDDAFPAAYNSFGSFLEGAKKLAPRLLDLAGSEAGQSLIGLLPGGQVANKVISMTKHPKVALVKPNTTASSKKKKQKSKASRPMSTPQLSSSQKLRGKF